MRASCTPTGNTLLFPVSPHMDAELTQLKSVDDGAGASDREDGGVGAIEDEDQEDWDDQELKSRGPKILRDVKTPTAAEIEQHNTTHIPAAAWCPPYCVQG